MQAAEKRTWTTAAAVAVFAVMATVATAWPAAAAPWPPADIAGVDPASPLLAPVDIEFEPPPAPAERAEITLALRLPRSWAGLLDLGIPSGESPSLSETRVWEFFLGSPDCVGLERLQVPDSTGDASFIARSLRHGVYFARNNPVGFNDPTGLYSGASNEELADAHNAMTPEQQEQFAEAQETALMVTGGVVLALAPGPEDAVLAVAGAQKLVQLAGRAGSFIKGLFKGGDSAGTGGEAVDIFRFVSDAELQDLSSSGGVFRSGPNSLEAKQFGLDVDEVAELGSRIGGDDAIVGARIPRSTLEALDGTPVDASILRSGSVTAQPGQQLELLNRTATHVRRVR